MIVILIIIIFVLCITIVYLGLDSFREKKIFDTKIEALEAIIIQITKKQIAQSDQLKLSEDLNENLKKSRAELNNNIFDLNYELLEILSKNNLLKNDK